MPGPVPAAITGFSGGAVNVARTEPSCMALVAATAVYWTEIEQQLANFVFMVLAPAHFQPGGAVGSPGNWVARVAIEQAESIRTRIKLIDAMVLPLIRGTEFEHEWILVRNQLQKRARERNEIVHAEWKVAGELPGKLVRLKPGAFEQWNEADFNSVFRRFHSLTMAIGKLSHGIATANARGELPTRP